MNDRDFESLWNSGGVMGGAHAPSSSAPSTALPAPAELPAQARAALGLHINATEGVGVSLPFGELRGVAAFGSDRLVIVAGCCMVTIEGTGVAGLREPILAHAVRSLSEGETVHGAHLRRVQIDFSFPVP